MKNPERLYDLVLFGATGFIGQLVVECLARSTQRGTTLRWALAGRDRLKLVHVRSLLAKLDPRLATLPLRVVDANDPASIEALVQVTKVICTTVGPYAKYGSNLVAACARYGTDYCDISGEKHWIRRMIEQHHRRAEKSGARIVHACGFDAIPSDLGTLLVQNYAQQRFGQPCNRVSAWFGEMAGQFGGGGFASLLHSMEEARRNPLLRCLAQDPNAFEPSPRVNRPLGLDRADVCYEPHLQRWTGPFTMATVNAPIVRRSVALFDYPWGLDFHYSEAASFPSGLRGLTMALGTHWALKAMNLAARTALFPKLLRRFVPSPGEGPSAAKRAKGYFVIRLIGYINEQPKVFGTVCDHRDPGCHATAQMLAEAAQSLALDNLSIAGGVLTPARCFGTTLIERLRRVGVILCAQDWTSSCHETDPFASNGS